MTRPIIQKTANRKQQKLRNSAMKCPQCMGCGLPNPDGNLLCLAHSNRLVDGKGRGIKATDESGAILCHRCHDFVDGRGGDLYGMKHSRETEQDYHRAAHLKTVAWWRKVGLIG